MSIILSPTAVQHFVDNNGQSANGYQLFTYIAGTTTKQATYSDSSGTPNSNPIILNQRGECDLWLDSTKTYKFVLTYPTDSDPPTTSIYTRDNIPGSYTGTIQSTQIIYVQTAAESAAGATPVNYFYPELHILRYGTNTTPGTTDMTAAMQACLNVAQQSHGTIVIDPGIYAISSVSIISTNGLRIQGSSSSSYTNVYGSVLKHTGNATMFLIDGNSAQANVVIDGVTFQGNSNSLVGLEFLNATFITLQNCTFLSFTNAGASALYFTHGVSLFTGVVKINNCNFIFNQKDIYCDKTEMNYYTVFECSFLAGQYGVYLGVTGSAMASQKFSIISSHFEQKANYSIYSAGGAQSLTIDNNYFEQVVGGDANPMIYIDGNVSSPVNSSISISGNNFAKQMMNAGNGVIYINAAVYGLRVVNNWNAYGGANDRYFVENLSFAGGSKDWYVEVVNGLSGVLGYPNQINGVATSVLSDYSKIAQSWTPGVSFGGGTTGITYSIQSGSYVRNGDLVTVFFRIVLTAKGSSTGIAAITGLPFFQANAQDQYGAGGVVGNYSGMSAVGSGINCIGLINTTTLNLATPGAVQITALADTNFTNTSAIMGQFTYRAA